MKKHFFYILTAVTAAILVSLFSANIKNYAEAGTLSIPNSFSAGQKIVATSMNQNFQAIASWSSVIASDNILDGGIASADLATSSIITAKIADQAVTTAKLADGAVTAAKFSATEYYWAGYHGVDCAWSNTDNGFKDFGADTSCTLTQTQNSGFGTVSSAIIEGGSSTQKKPGIVFTPPYAGAFMVCARVNTYGGTALETYGYRLLAAAGASPVVASSTIVELLTRQPATTANIKDPVSLCGIYVADTMASTRSIVIQGGGNGSAASTSIEGNVSVVTPRSVIEWTIWSL